MSVWTGAYDDGREIEKDNTGTDKLHASDSLWHTQLDGTVRRTRACRRRINDEKYLIVDAGFYRIGGFRVFSQFSSGTPD